MTTQSPLFDYVETGVNARISLTEEGKAAHAEMVAARPRLIIEERDAAKEAEILRVHFGRAS